MRSERTYILFCNNTIYRIHRKIDFETYILIINNKTLCHRVVLQIENKNSSIKLKWQVRNVK